MSLDAGLLRRHEGPLVWGVRDCVQLAAAAVEHYGGWRPVLPFYSNKREALELLATDGGLRELVRQVLGEPIDPRSVQIGDIVLTSFRDTGPMLGVADPPGFWVLVEPDGFLPLSLDFATEVWACRR